LDFTCVDEQSVAGVGKFVGRETIVASNPMLAERQKRTPREYRPAPLFTGPTLCHIHAIFIKI
jgi:hypothetical protein